MERLRRSPLPEFPASRTAHLPSQQVRRSVLLSPLRWSKANTVIVAFAAIALVAAIDWRSADDVPLGFVYLLPMLLLGRVLKAWQTLLAAFLCTFLTEILDPFTWNLRTGLSRDFLYFMAFFAIAMFSFQVNRSRITANLHLQRIESEAAGRLQAERQLLSLIETSPAAIITTDMNGAILMANEAAHRLLDVQPSSLMGRCLRDFFPALAQVTRRQPENRLFRTVMQAHGRRASGDSFLAEVCFSTYPTADGVLFTGMILDSTEEFRSREESSLHQLLLGSRVALSAMSHEVRNLCGAIAAVHRNLSAAGKLGNDKDLEALSNLVSALERIAAIDLRPETEKLSPVDLKAVLEDVKIVIAPALDDGGIALTWDVPSDLPLVSADGTNLMQVFLNLTTNSIRALSEKTKNAALSITATFSADKAFVHVVDNGGGVRNSEHLFRPFQPGAQNVGLGLYLAKAFTRSFAGDLTYRATGDGSCFTVELNTFQKGSSS